MIVILISWIFIFYIISITGIIAKESLNLSNNKAFTLLYGIVFQTIFISFFAFFYKIDSAFFIINSLIIIFISFKIKNKIIEFLKSLLISFDCKSKVLFFIFIIITALKSAQLPSIFDNETYYIQTIKWLNEYGFVKGIANVHPFLSQCSFWHVFQSGFNFSFITNTLNDVNGLLLIIWFYYFLDKYSNLQSDNYFIANSFFIVIYMQFIDSPSPDLPILVFLSILFNEFIFNNLNTKKRKSLILFILFAVFIKLTIVPILLLLLFLMRKNKKTIMFCIYLSFVFILIWITKNIIITGYPLFPLSLFDFNFDWKLPIEIMDYMYKNINNLGYAENASISKTYNLIQKLNFWIHLKGVNGFFNLSIIILFLITPFTKLFNYNHKFKILYCVLFIHFVFLLYTSPQYRFFLATYICFGSVVAFEIFKYKKFNNYIMKIMIFLIVLSLFIDVKNMNYESKFNVNQLIKSESNSKYTNTKIKEKKIGNITYFDPNLPNIYETSNGNLPCVNEKIFDFYLYYPQLRTSNIKDGFRSKKNRK
jgi:hypothetical protein